MTITEASHISNLIRAILGADGFIGAPAAGDVADSMRWLGERAGKTLQMSLRVDEETALAAAERIKGTT